MSNETNKARNLKEIGVCLRKIANRLMSNENLLKLLYYQDKDPFSHSSLSDLQLENEIFNHYIMIVPKLPPQEDSKSTITIMAMSGKNNSENDNFSDIAINIEVYVPITQWIIKDSNLRPFAIMSEIQNSLNNKVINGIGRMKGGDFDYSFTTDEITCYIQHFKIINYD